MNAFGKRHMVRIHPYVDAEVAQQLDVHCKGSGATLSSVVEAALREHLDRDGNFMSTMKHLDRIGRRIERTDREVELFIAAFGTWVKIWFAHNPRIVGDDLDLVRREAESRFAEFIEEVAQRIAADEGFFGAWSRAGLGVPDADTSAHGARTHEKGET
jgi:hypothetical protein